MKLLVTGGAGFIGSNFIRYILNKSDDVHIVNFDCLNYAGNLENLSDLSSDSRYSFFRGDITSTQDVEECLSQGMDAVINFAAETHVDRSILDSAAFVRTNVEGTRVLLEACRRQKISRFIQISTDEIYGSLDETGKFTEQSPVAPNSPYAASKAAADLLVRAYHKTYGMEIMVTRCCNNYGPYQFPEKLIPLMVLNALENKPLPVYGDGRHARDWIHVEDHCRALECVMMEGHPGQIYNIGSDQEKQNLEVVHQILGLLGKSPELIQFVRDRPGHDRRYAIDATFLRRELGWRPQISFEEGLAQTVRWYQENAQWVAHVRTGSYLNYYQQMYQNRDQTLKNL
ncbi:dTDP-glucose 4,6-dehydratase [Acidobacteria bacterium AH-259-D05]|nr:dTDP-glucose 4,6-dehydratase [Acidobacteria bacterium AH-259-D05]